MELNRRKFLQITGATVVGVTGGVLVYRHCFRGAEEPKKLPVAIRKSLEALRRHFPSLNFEDEEGIAYINAYHRHIHELSPEVVQSRDFRMRFLLSTNALLTDRPQDKPVKFVGLYHPSRIPCHNPLTEG